MPTILNPRLDIRPVTPHELGGPVYVEITYTLRFTPMERLLATYGLQFVADIRLEELDPFPPGSDDDLGRHSSMLVTSEQITSAPSSDLTLTSPNRRYNRPDLRGPEDEFHPFERHIRAAISVSPVPDDATEVTEDEANTNFILLNTEGTRIEFS